MITAKLILLGAGLLFLLTLPCQAGPCAKDIERVTLAINTRLGAIAAAGPSTSQSVEAQMHRQPTPRSMAQAERKLGELPESKIAVVRAAIQRAREADAAGDLAACQKALAEVEQELHD